MLGYTLRRLLLLIPLLLVVSFAMFAIIRAAFARSPSKSDESMLSRAASLLTPTAPL